MIPLSYSGPTVVDAIFEPFFSGTTLGLDASAAGDIDGVALVGDTLLLSIRGNLEVDDLLVRDEDVFTCEELELDGGLWTCEEGEFLYVDGSAEGPAGNNDVKGEALA